MVAREDLGVDHEAWLCCRLCKKRIQELSGGDLSGIEAAIERAIEEHECQKATKKKKKKKKKRRT